MPSIPESFMYFIIFCDCSKCIFLVDYPGTLFTGTKSSFIEDLLLPDIGRYGSQHHSCMRPLFLFFNLLTCILLLFSFIGVGVSAVG
jgi:hypothetical protein